MTANELLKLHPYWQTWWPAYLGLVISIIIAIGALNVSGNPVIASVARFCLITGVCCFAWLIWIRAWQRWIFIRRTDNLASQTTIGIYQDFIEFHSPTGRSLYRWSYLNCNCANNDAVSLYVREANQIMVLPRRVFSPTEWMHIENRVASLPKNPLRGRWPF